MALKAITVDEMTQNNGHDTVKGHSMSQFWYHQKPIHDLLLVNIITYILSRTISEISWSICQIFTINRGVPLLNAVIWGEPINLRLGILP